MKYNYTLRFSLLFFLFLGVPAHSAYINYCYNPAPVCHQVYRGTTTRLICQIPPKRCEIQWVPDPAYPNHSPAPTQPHNQPPPNSGQQPPPMSPERAACFANANETSALCQNAYNDLHQICKAFNAMMGGAAVGTGRLLWAKIMDDTLDSRVGAAMRVAGGTAGFQVEDVLVPCASLTNRAIAFCRAGAGRMKANCPY